MSVIAKLRKKTRSARLEVFREFVRGFPESRERPFKVIDLGGTVAFWENWWGLTDDDWLQITLINNHSVDTTCNSMKAQSKCILNINQDATTLTVEYLRNYDLVFSNSFFEHLKSRENQTLLANTITLSGVPYFIQVPNKNSPVDPHHPFAPFFALYPYSLRVRLLTFSAFGPSTKATSLEAAREWQNYYAPLGMRDMKALFPNGSFKIERPFGVPMSILAFGDRQSC